MRKTLLLHIGSPKTGTTSIQDFLFGNSEFLAGFGLIIPNAGLVQGGGHRDIAIMIRKNTDKEERDQFFDELKLEVKSSPHDFFLMSCEHLWPLKQFGNLKRGLDDIFDQVCIIFYWRKQWSMIPSHYAQKVKSGSMQMDLPQFINANAGAYNYYEIEQRWREEFSTESIYSFSFEDSVIHGDIRPHFYSSAINLASNSGVSIDPKNLNAYLAKSALDKKRSNRFVGCLMTNLLLQVNRSSMSDEEKAHARKFLLDSKEVFADSQPAEMLLPTELRKQVEDFYSELNKKMSMP